MPGKAKNNLLHQTATELAEAVYEETKQEQGLLSPQAQKKKIAHEIEDHVKKAQKKIQQGIEYCIHAIPDKKIATQVGNVLFSPLAKLAIEDAGSKLLNNVSWKEQLKIPEPTMQHLYDAAKYYFDKDDMKKAECAYYFLATLDPAEISFWVGLGHASTQLQHFEQAINAYAMASMLVPKDPWPHIWAGNAFLEQKDKTGAKIAFECAEALAGNDQNLITLIKDKLAICKHK